MSEKKRVEEIDIIKALGILCVVLGHADFPGTRFVFLFHIAVFFIASGYFFRSRFSDSFRDGIFPFFKKRLKQLWLPFFVWQTVFICLNNVFLQWNVYTSNPELFQYLGGQRLMRVNTLTYPKSLSETVVSIGKAAIFQEVTPLGRPLWFLGTLFFVGIGYCVIDYLVKKAIKKSKNRQIAAQALISDALLFAGYICQLLDFEAFGFARVASCYCLFFIGVLLGQVQKKIERLKWKSFSAIGLFSLAVLVFASYLYPDGLSIDLRGNVYQNPAYFIVCSLAGWAFLYSLAYFIKQLPVKGVFTRIGTRTLSILIFHYAAFKIVIAVVIAYYALPAFCLAALPHLYGESGAWWLAYGAVGIAVPVGLNLAYRRLVSICKRVWKHKESGEKVHE